MRRALLVLLTSLTACSVIEPSPQVVATDSTNWRSVVTDKDRVHLRDWRQTFLAALAEARQSGHSEAVAREGVLLDPDSALAGGAIPNGLYRCRTIKVGAKSPAARSFFSTPVSTCAVRQQGKLQSFTKFGTSQRLVGTIFPSDGLRQVFLGTLVLGDETRAQHYGTDDDRDVAGYVERIGPIRWRLVVPSPAFESNLDVTEMVSAS